MTVTIIQVQTHDDASESVRIIERLGVVVTSYAYDPARKEMECVVEGLKADFLLRRKLTSNNLRTDWVDSGYRG